MNKSSVAMLVIIVAFTFVATNKSVNVAVIDSVFASDDIDPDSTPSTPNDLAISGATEIEVGETTTLTIEGLPPLDDTKTIGESLGWVSAIRIYSSAPEDHPILIKKRIELSYDPLAWIMTLDITPSGPGAIVVIVDWNEGECGHAFHRVEVGGIVPPPLPPPPPPNENPYPAPSAEHQAMVAKLSSLTVEKNLSETLSKVLSSASQEIVSKSESNPLTATKLKALLEELRSSAGVEKGKDATLSGAMESVMGAMLGDDPSREMKYEDATALTSIAWAVWESGH